MSEGSLMRSIMLACSKGATRLFRMQVGMAWIGNATRFTRTETVTVRAGDVLVRQARPFHAGVEGMSDLAGWTACDGRAIYTAIEVKTEDGRATEAQMRFIAAVLAAGGIAGVARSVDEARALLEKCTP